MSATEIQLADQHHKPRHHARQHAGAVDVNKHLLRIRNEVVQPGADQQADDGHGNAVHRHAAGGQLGQRSGQLAVLGQGVQHAATAVHAAVAAGQRRSQHHEVNDTGGGDDADLGEGQHERAAGSADTVPWEDSDDDKDGADIEDQDAPQDIVNRAFQRNLRVLGFAGGNTDQLNPLIGRHDNTQREQEALPAAGKETAVLGQVGKTDRLPPIAKAKQDHPQPHQNHHNDGGHLNHGKPELQLAVKAHRRQVGQRHHRHGDQRRHPLRDFREPELHIDPNGSDFGDANGNPHKPIAPGGEVTEIRPHIFMRINGKRARYRLQKQHFAHRAHNKEHEQPGDDIGQQDRWPRPFQRAGRPHKQTDANGAAQSNQLNMPGFEPPVQSLRFFNVCHKSSMMFF
ncbi:hypothetical protein D3C81_232430 [compost metagenome]